MMGTNIRIAGVLLCVFRIASVCAQEYLFLLYPDTVPNSKPTSITEKIERGEYSKITNVSSPGIAVYLPTRRFATGQAVVICPGGGYVQLSMDLECTDIARYFNSIGVAAAVLKYRLPSMESNIRPHLAPLMDAKRAVRLVRFNAQKWNIDPRKIGIMGFSAGGHLASTLGTHFDYGNHSSADSVEQQSCRPDFMILVYPVISFTDSVKHTRSRKALLGEDPDMDLVFDYSNELQVKADTPPAFLVHADNDSGVPVENSLRMVQAMRAKHIPVELHVLSEGGHGFGLGLDNNHVASWTRNLKWWLDWLNRIKRSER